MLIRDLVKGMGERNVSLLSFIIFVLAYIFFFIFRHLDNIEVIHQQQPFYFSTYETFII